jgi:hypothetical protein
MQIHRITYVLLGLVIIAGTISISSLKSKVQSPSGRQPESQEKLRQRDEEAKKHFPTAEFDEQEPTDPQKQASFRKKKARHNRVGLVDRNPGPDRGGGVFIPEGQFDFPALPTGLSDVVVLGEVRDAQAHLSEDKSNVFSEFTVQIDKVLKPYGTLAEQITVERTGGYVRYPDGRKLLYLLGTARMPKVGARYVLFLKSISKTENFSILTAYELGAEGVSPLDWSPQFETYRGYSESSFFTELSSALAKPATPQE